MDTHVCTQVYMPWEACRGLKTVCESWFFPSTLSVPGIELKS